MIVVSSPRSVSTPYPTRAIRIKSPAVPVIMNTQNPFDVSMDSSLDRG